MIAFLRRYLEKDVPPATSEKVAALAKLMADVTPPQRIEGMEWPERDESKPGCTHLYFDNDEIALEQRARQNVVPMKWGSR